MTNEERRLKLLSHLEHVHQHVFRMAQCLGLYEELNEATRLKIPVNAKNGAREIRYVCLLANLIAGCALFWRPIRKDDVSFHLFSDALRMRHFVDHCASLAKEWLPDGRRALENERLVHEKVRTFLEEFDQCMPLYEAIKPMRNKSIAHLTNSDYPRPLVGNVLDLTRLSIKMTEKLSLILDGRDHVIGTLVASSRTNVRSLMRAGTKVHIP